MKSPREQAACDMVSPQRIPAEVAPTFRKDLQESLYADIDATDWGEHTNWR